MQDIFSRNIDIDKIAFLNWRISKDDEINNLINLADGFMLSSIEIAKLCLKDNDDKKADILIFPILANANHGIELYLKGIIWLINAILKDSAKTEGKHNIKQLYETVRAKIKLYKGLISVKSFNKETLELNRYINELYAKIKATPGNDKMDFSRYPFSSKYEAHFYVDEIGNVEIDLENFVVRFMDIKQSLEQIAEVLYFIELTESETIASLRHNMSLDYQFASDSKY